MTKPFHPVIGVIGGGQLGKMLIEASGNWNVRFSVLDPDAQAPARRWSDTFIQGSLKDPEKIKALSTQCNVITYEIEHVNQAVLKELETTGFRVVPSADVLGIIQDKGLQKQFYQSHAINSTPYKLIDHAEGWKMALNDLRGEILVAKSRKGGYDGRGVELVSRKRLEEGYIPFQEASLLEEFVENATELSVMLGRRRNGETSVYPCVQMHFDSRSNLVDYLYSPAHVSEAIQKKAMDLALKAVDALHSEGLFAVELFVDKAGEVFVNEIAPRPHNSGHHTIEGFYTSQYEMLLRVLLDLPLGSTRQILPAVMVNIVGPPDVSGKYRLEGYEAVLAEEGVYLHLYNKEQTRPDRKIGHFTCLADTLEAAVEKAMRVKQTLKIVADQ